MDWVIKETKKITKSLNTLPRNIQASYEAWRSVVLNNGIDSLRQIKGYHFEKLSGQRSQQHSCRLSKGYRVFFRIDKKIVTVYVLEVNKHEY